MLKKIKDFVTLVASVSGFVPRHATPLRSVVMLSAVLFNMRLMRSSGTAPVHPLYLFIGSTAAYMGFIYTILSKRGLRHRLIKRFKHKEEAYKAYEAWLGFLFFMNGASIGYLSAERSNTLPFHVSKKIVQPLAVFMFLTGWTVKLWSAKVVGVDIYYWKDMFYGRKISDFVEEGPYKIFRNPMYGIGQLQTYATALWYRSLPGLVSALVYQLAVFSFYYFQEKKFIERVYLQNETGLAADQMLRA